MAESLPHAVVNPPRCPEELNVKHLSEEKTGGPWGREKGLSKTIKTRIKSVGRLEYVESKEK